MKVKILISVVISVMFSAFLSFADSTITYSNTNFNGTSPGWSNTLTINNNGTTDITLKTLQFDTSNPDIPALNGSLMHLPDYVKKTEKGVTTYTITTKSQWGAKTYTTISAGLSANLTGIPITHNSNIKDGIPEYFSLPSNVIITLVDGSTVNPVLEGTSTNPDPAPGQIAGTYFTNWTNYRYSDESLMLFPNQIPFKSINTVYYMVGKVDPVTADLSFSDSNHDQYYIPALATLRQQYPYLKVLYSYGGWGSVTNTSSSFPSHDLAAIFDQEDDVLLDTLAGNMVNLMLVVGFNGVDIDYEWTALCPPNNTMVLTPIRAKGYQNLLIKLRQHMDDATKITGEKYYLTSAVFAGVDQIADFENNNGSWKIIGETVDALDVMTYDFHGQFDAAKTKDGPDNVTGFLSGMGTSHEYTNPITDKFNVIDSIQGFINAGVSKDKLVVGIPAYTRIEKVSSDSPVTGNNKGYYIPLALAADQPNGEGDMPGGTFDYKAIIDSKYIFGSVPLPKDIVYVPANMSTTGMGVKEKTPWIYSISDNIFGSFDDGISSKYKGQWIKNQGLHGFMVWEIDGDIPQTDSAFEEKSVVYNACLGMTEGNSKQKMTEL